MYNGWNVGFRFGSFTTCTVPTSGIWAYASLKRIHDLAATAKHLTSGVNGLTWATCGTGPSLLCPNKSKTGNFHSCRSFHPSVGQYFDFELQIPFQLFCLVRWFRFKRNCIYLLINLLLVGYFEAFRNLLRPKSCLRVNFSPPLGRTCYHYGAIYKKWLPGYLW